MVCIPYATLKHNILNFWTFFELCFRSHCRSLEVCCDAVWSHDRQCLCQLWHFWKLCHRGYDEHLHEFEQNYRSKLEGIINKAVLFVYTDEKFVIHISNQYKCLHLIFFKSYKTACNFLVTRAIWNSPLCKGLPVSVSKSERGTKQQLDGWWGCVDYSTNLSCVHWVGLYPGKKITVSLGLTLE